MIEQCHVSLYFVDLKSLTSFTKYNPVVFLMRKFATNSPIKTSNNVDNPSLFLPVFLFQSFILDPFPANKIGLAD